MNIKIIILILLTFYSCNNIENTTEINDSGGNSYDRLELNKLDKNSNLRIDQGNVKFKIVNGIKYNFSIVQALDFIKRNGDIPNEEDVNDLKEESVLIFEISDVNQFRSIFENRNLQTNKDNMIQYLIGNIKNDIIIFQAGNKFEPNGVQYEGVVGAHDNKIRVLAFFKGVKTDQEYELQYNDFLYSAGKIKLFKTIKTQSV